MSAEKDVSNRALAALLVLTLVVTLVGTWLVIDALAAPVSVAGVAAPTGNSQAAEVTLTILPSPVSIGTSAQVGLQILPSS